MGEPFEFLIAGGGIAGLAAAVALGADGHTVRLAEQRQPFPEIGAGLQLSPNAWRCLRDWGLEPALRLLCSLPDAMVARDMASGRELGRLPLGERAVERYGASYGTLLRTDLHQLLLAKARTLAGFEAALGVQVQAFSQTEAGVLAQLVDSHGARVDETADALLIADGAHSRLSGAATAVDANQRAGYTAYRGLVNPLALPVRLRSNSICAWFGRHLHAVTYPVKDAQWLNVVVIIADALLPHRPQRGTADMAQVTAAIAVRQALHADLQDLMAAVDAHGQPLLGARWTEWPLWLRRPVRSPRELAHQRWALLGDAAHPMVPFLAQGAAMAIEDAAQLRHSLQHAHGQLVHGLQDYAQARVRRVARVQRRAWRNGRIFHLGGLMAASRNAALGLLAGQVMDNPWLYAGGPVPAAAVDSTRH